MRAGFGFVLAFLAGCTSTQTKPCTNDPAVCGPDAWCNPATQLCERPPADLALTPPDLLPSDLAVCKVGFMTGAALTLGATQTPSNLAIANLDGNQFGDVLFLEFGIDKLTVLLQTDNNVFAAQRQYAVGNQPHSMAIADFDGGGLDVALISVASGPSGLFQVLTGAAGGALNPAQNIANVPGSFGQLHAAAFLGSAHPDLIALSGSTSNDSLATLKNNSSNGTLSFTRTGQAYSPKNELRIASGDVDGDGYADALTARGSGTSYYVTVDYGNSSGLNVRSADTSGVMAAPVDIDAGDINGDRRDDIVTVDAGGTINVWYGQAGGQPPSQNGKPAISVGSALSQLVMADGSNKLAIPSVAVL